MQYVAGNRFPIKQVRDALALARVCLTGQASMPTPLPVRERMKCLRFYFHADGIRRLFSVSNRSGARWIQLALELALDLAAGGDGEYVYENDHFYPRHGMMFQRLDWRVPTGEWESQHARTTGPAMAPEKCFVTHNPFYRVRTNQVMNMKTIVVTRAIPAILLSLHSKFGRAAQRPGVDRNDGAAFDWDASLSRQIAFFNSWGDVVRWHPRIRHYRYEEMKADPVGTHMEIADFWGFRIPEDCMAEGLRRASKTEMMKRMPPEHHAQNMRVSIRNGDAKQTLSDDRLRHIIGRLNRELVHDFGYAFDLNTPYDTIYD
jgi:hypothetical protein